MGNDEKCCDDQGELSSSLQKSIKNIIEAEGFLTYNTYQKQIPTEGGSYLGELYEVDVKGKTAEGDKELHLFVKKLVPEVADNLKGHFSVAGAYSSETFVYTELSKIFDELQREAKVPEGDRYNIVKGYKEPFNEAIILDNAAKKGFKTGYRMDVISLKFAELSIEQLAKFHGLSWILEKRRPKYFEEQIQTKKIPITSDEAWLSVVRGLMIGTASSIEDSELRKQIEEFIPNAVKHYVQYFDNAETHIHCLCHGDYRANNILMKKIDGEVTEVIPVDYQLIHYGCPVNDFLYLIFLGTDRQFRKKHLANLKDLYYSTLTRFLAYFDMDVNDICPRKEFENVLKDRLNYGIIVVLMFAGFIFATESEIVDVGEAMPVEWKPKLDIKFQDRFREIFQDCINCDYL